MKRHLLKTLTGIILIVGFFMPGELPAQEAKIPQGIERLKRQIETVLQGVEGSVGVAAKHLETGEEMSINGDVYYPMASVFKIPVLVEVMAQVQEGRFMLDDEINIRKTDQHLGSGMLADLDAPGIKLSIRNVINLMMMISDNSAADILTEKVGVDKVNKRLRSYGIKGITVNRTCQHLIMDVIGLDYNTYGRLPIKDVLKAYQAKKSDRTQAAAEAQKNFSSIIMDQSTPKAMNRLLELIFEKKILDEESCSHIIGVMLKCQTGASRIKGDLPSGSKVAHKTGTIDGTANDVGILYLPDGLGHVALSIFTKDMLRTSKTADIIAQIARFVYDYYYFSASRSIQ